MPDCIALTFRIQGPYTVIVTPPHEDGASQQFVCGCCETCGLQAELTASVNSALAAYRVDKASDTCANVYGQWLIGQGGARSAGVDDGESGLGRRRSTAVPNSPAHFEELWEEAFSGSTYLNAAEEIADACLDAAPEVCATCDAGEAPECPSVMELAGSVLQMGCPNDKFYSSTLSQCRHMPLS
jgi:hypothetical protein